MLSGVFSDVNGDHTAGTLLLNPEGFEHAPSSAEGCEILVRLRQYPGTDRPQVALNTASVPWEPLPGHSAVQRKQLFRSSRCASPRRAATRRAKARPPFMSTRIPRTRRAARPAP